MPAVAAQLEADDRPTRQDKLEVLKPSIQFLFVIPKNMPSTESDAFG